MARDKKKEAQLLYYVLPFCQPQFVIHSMLPVPMPVPVPVPVPVPCTCFFIAWYRLRLEMRPSF